jgi:hypothetical protein
MSPYELGEGISFPTPEYEDTKLSRRLELAIELHSGISNAYHPDYFPAVWR